MNTKQHNLRISQTKTWNLCHMDSHVDYVNLRTLTKCIFYMLRFGTNRVMTAFTRSRKNLEYLFTIYFRIQNYALDSNAANMKAIS